VSAIVVAAIATPLVGCTATRTLRRPLGPSELDQINCEVRGHGVELVLREEALAGGETVRDPAEGPSYSLKLALDRVTWEDGAGLSHAAPTAAVRELKYLSPGSPRLKAAWTGAGIGFLAGATVGTIYGFSKGSDPHGVLFELTAGDKAVLYGALIGTAGSLLGAIVGAASAEKTVVTLEP